MVTLEAIESAKARIAGVATCTTLAKAPILSQRCEADVWLKKENLQITGAFKVRGAYNCIASLDEQTRNRGVIAASAGNHAQGVAFAAHQFGITATIVMPEATPLTKVDGVKYYGADVVLYGNNYDEAYEKAQILAKESGSYFVHPFEDDAVIAGQGTIALEILEALDGLDAVIVPVGGGGLIAGISTAIKAINSAIEVIGVVAEGAPALMQSFVANRVINSQSVRTIADGIAVKNSSEKNLALLKAHVDAMVSVDDQEIASAILFLLEKQKLVVEGAGAVGVAAMLHHKLPHLKGKRVAIVVSGGNMDVTLLSVIIEKGLMKSYRKMKITVKLIDKPGALTQLTALLASLSANIVHIAYDRTSTELDYGDAHVMIHIETKGESHQQEIEQLLRQEGYWVEQKH